MERSERIDNPAAIVSAARYNPVAKSLHWLVFALVLVQFVIGGRWATRRGVIPERSIAPVVRR
jgi:hypothetical protein